MRFRPFTGLGRTLTAHKGSSITRWLNGTYTGDSEAVAAGVERWLDTRADAAMHSLDGAGPGCPTPGAHFCNGAFPVKLDFQ